MSEEILKEKIVLQENGKYSYSLGILQTTRDFFSATSSFAQLMSLLPWPHTAEVTAELPGELELHNL